MDESTGTAESAGMPGPAAATLLLQFAREPVAGQVKTRLIPHLTPDQACTLHSQMVLCMAEQLLSSHAGDVALCVAGDTSAPLFQQCRELGVAQVRPQCGVDLGERMYHGLASGLLTHDKVILVGSDCPFIDDAYIEQAVNALDSVPVVLGPAEDGGYVLIGVTRVARALFRGVSWGTEAVYGQTVSALEGLGWRYVQLAALPDIDRPQDLPLWEAFSSN